MPSGRAASHDPPPAYEAASRPDPFQVLTAEHALLRLQLGRAREAARADGPADRARREVAALADGFRIHQRREDLVVCPLCDRLFGGPDGVASVLRRDHEGIRAALAAVLEGPGSPAPVSVSRLDALGRLLEDHFVKEERILFPLMTAYLPGRETADLDRRLRDPASH